MTPAWVDFEPVAVGDSASVDLSVLNRGPQDRRIYDIYTSDEGSPFESGSLMSVLVPPGMQTGVTVTFEPTDGFVECERGIDPSDHGFPLKLY